MKKVLGRMIKGIGIVLLVLLLVIILYVVIGKIYHANQSKIKSADGVQEYVTIEVNGIQQELHIRGENQNNPVILFVHGGPGSPTGYFDYEWEPYLNDEFTIVTYNQRGCGRTYYANPEAEVSRELILQDLNEIVDYLRDRFRQDKIIIMGHSWGTLLGTLYVYEQPDKVCGYIGVGQVVNTYTGEDIAINEAVRRAEAANDSEYVETITEAYQSFCKTHKIDQYFMTYRGMEAKYLLGAREKTTLQLVPTVITSPDFNMKDAKWFLIDSNPILMAEDNPLTAELFSFDANEMKEYQVPMYFISGGNDYVTPFAAVQDYCANITAPEKNIVIIDGAGHNTFVDVPEEFANAVKQFDLTK